MPSWKNVPMVSEEMMMMPTQAAEGVKETDGHRKLKWDTHSTLNTAKDSN